MNKKVGVRKPQPVDQIPPFAPHVAAGMLALSQGTATPHQQQAVYLWLLQEAGAIGAPSYRPGDPDGTMFMEGRRFVGIAMLHLTQQKADQDG